MLHWAKQSLPYSSKLEIPPENHMLWYSSLYTLKLQSFGVCFVF